MLRQVTDRRGFKVWHANVPMLGPEACHFRWWKLWVINTTRGQLRKTQKTDISGLLAVIDIMMVWEVGTSCWLGI